MGRADLQWVLPPHARHPQTARLGVELEAAAVVPEHGLAGRGTPLVGTGVDAVERLLPIDRVIGAWC